MARPGDPGRREQRREQRHPARGGQGALGLDDAADVRLVGRAAGLLDLAPERVELGAERLDVGGGQVGVRLDVGDGHAVGLLSRSGVRAGMRQVRCRGRSRRRRRRCRSGPVEPSTCSVAGAQVAGGAGRQGQHAALADAHPAAERHLHAGVLAGLQQGGRAVDGDALAGPGEGDGAALPAGAVERDGEALQVQGVRRRRRPAQAFPAASSIAGGPQAQVCRSVQSGTTSSRSSSASMPIASVCCRCSRSPGWRVGEVVQLVPEEHVGLGGGGVHQHARPGRRRGRPSCAASSMIGVIPLPAVRKRILAGGGSGSTNSPAGAARRTIVPARGR